MRWDRIGVLIDRVKDDLIRQGYEFRVYDYKRPFHVSHRYRYFHLDASQPSPIKFQQGTVRTNCMDNLDRTNVVQAALAKWTLGQQLIQLGILLPGSSIDDYEALSKDFRESRRYYSTRSFIFI